MTNGRRAPGILDRLRFSTTGLKRPSAVYLRLYSLAMQREHLQARMAAFLKRVAADRIRREEIASAIERMTGILKKLEEPGVLTGSAGRGRETGGKRKG